MIAPGFVVWGQVFQRLPVEGLCLRRGSYASFSFLYHHGLNVPPHDVEIKICFVTGSLLL